MYENVILVPHKHKGRSKEAKRCEVSCDVWITKLEVVPVVDERQPGQGSTLFNRNLGGNSVGPNCPRATEHSEWPASCALWKGVAWGVTGGHRCQLRCLGCASLWHLFAHGWCARLDIHGMSLRSSEINLAASGCQLRSATRCRLQWTLLSHLNLTSFKWNYKVH